MIEIKNRFTDTVIKTVDADTLYKANLYVADLYGANLREANLYGANLIGANLREANLREADLREANLHVANLYGANLIGANLRGANLIGADLREANLYGANLSGADLSRATGIISGGTPNEWCCYGWLYNDVLSIRVGCREKSFAEAVEYWSNKPDRQEVLIMCHAIASIAVTRGWRLEDEP